jgi:EmrB/QacA subfamily drug resistance transporter
MKKAKKELMTLIIMTIAAAIGYMAQTAITTGMAAIMDELQVNAGTVQWLITAFSLTTGVLIPLTAYLAHKFSTKKLLNASMIVFTLGSLLGFIAPNFSLLIIARVFQAAGCGILFPVLQMSIFKVLPKKKWNVAMGIIGMAIAVAPTIGPAIGGIMVDVWGWRSIFLGLSILGVILFLCSLFFSTKLLETKRCPLDIPSFLLTMLLCVGIVIGLGNIGSYGLVSIFVWAPILIGVLSTFIFVKRQKTLKEPFLELSVFKNKNFSVGAISLAIIQFTVVGITVILPIFIQKACGFSATVSGLIILPSSLMMAVFSILSGVLAGKFGTRSLAVLGNILMVIGSFSMLFMNLNTSILYITVTQIVRCMGIGLATTPINTWLLASVKEKIGDGTAISNTLRQIAGAMGSAVLAMIMTYIAGGAVTNSAESVAGFQVSSALTVILAIVSTFLSIIYIKQDIKIENSLLEEPECDC